MEKNILFYFSWQLNPVHFGVVIEKLEAILIERKGKPGKIYFLICDGILRPCYTNRNADPSICNICRFNSAIGLDKFKDRIEVIQISQFMPAEQAAVPFFSYSSIDDIRQLQYKDVSIGYGALSSYISFTRNLEPIMDAVFRDYFDRLLQSQVALSDAVLKIISEEKINECYFFNGRTADTRPVYDICRNKAIDFISLEMIKKADDEFYINEFKNCLPHDIDFHHTRTVDQWENSIDATEKKIKTGSSFFENRRNGILVRDRKVYTGEQQLGILPEGMSSSRKNIAIFISSEDEFASIGDIFEKLAVFKTQQEAIEVILNKFNNGQKYHFYIRIHPNLTDINYSYHSRLKDMEKKYENATVIAANSSVSTYSLIDAADTVVVFGSTVGAEACYWGKPVILLAGSFYYHLDIAYKPSSRDELFELLMQELAPKPKLEAIKYGYYLMSYQNYTRKNVFSPYPITFFKKVIGLGHNHLKIMGSGFIFRITEKLLYAFMRFKSSKKLVIPRAGN